MKNFTKLFCAAALFMGAVSANAGERVDAVFDKVQSGGTMTWDADNLTFSWDGQYSNQVRNIAFVGMDVPLGDITGYEELVVNCDIIEGAANDGKGGYRVMLYSTEKGNTADGGIQYVTESGEKTFKLSEIVKERVYLTNCQDIVLSGWESYGTVKVNYMYLVKSDDPAAGARKVLNEAITKGSNVHELGWTPSSFSAVTDAVSAGLSAVEGSDASAMQQAADDIENAINSLEPANGYTPLTKDLFNNAGCNWEPYMVSGLPYGDGSVLMENYADLSNFEYLMVGTKSGVPRFCMNRTAAQGQQAATKEGSEMIDINSNNGTTWSAEKYEVIGDNKVFSIDLSAIKSDYGYAYLHCIKNQWGDPLIVGSMMLTQGVPNIDPMSVGIKSINAVKADNTIYDLQGRRVNQAVKGVYVINGKKVIR